jgi:CPA1 family monovalent cation:H+ antiporter
MNDARPGKERVADRREGRRSSRDHWEGSPASMDIEAVFVLLFVVATAVALAVRRLYLPYTVALVIAGLVLGLVHLFPAPALTKNLLFSIFLPGLIFEAAFRIDFREFWRNRITIVSLAVPGVIASTALIAVILAPVANALDLVQGFTWHHALVFGALISATDPIAVVGLFRSLGAPRRLTMLLEGESLLNDGTAIVFFTLSLSLLSGTLVTPGQIALEFVTVVGMGAVVGAAIGLTASVLLRRVADPMIQITLTTIAAYGSFVTSEALHFSGVIATVAAGLICGNYGYGAGIPLSGRLAVDTFWEYIGFALNSIIFLLIGLEIRLPTLLSYWLPIVVAYLVVTVGRTLVIAAGHGAVRLTKERFPWRWGVVLTWGGLRGALPMVLALSLPASLPYRDLIVAMTFGVVILSILLQGASMSALMRRFGVVAAPTDRTVYELRRGALEAADRALKEIDDMASRHLAAPATLESLREEYSRRLEQTVEAPQSVPVDREALRREESYRVRRHLLLVERERIMEAFREGWLADRSRERLLADIDARLLTLETEGRAPSAPPPSQSPSSEPP